MTRLGHWLQQAQHPFESGLGPGASEVQLDQLEALTHRLPEHLRQLYCWRTPPGREAEPLPADDTWVLLNVHEVGEAYDEVRAWPQGSDLLPFLVNGSNDYLCVALQGRAQWPSGSVVEIRRGQGCSLRFADLTRWLELSVAGLERGLLTLEPGGGLHPSNPFTWEAYLLEQNPGYELGDPTPSPELAEATCRVGVSLQNIATALGTLTLITLVVAVKVLGREVPRAGFVAILLGLLVSAACLFASQVLIRRRSRIAS